MENDTKTTTISAESIAVKEAKPKTKLTIKKTAGSSAHTATTEHEKEQTPVQESAHPTAKSNSRYISAVGRRKTSVARVRITESSKNTFTINHKDLATYFPTKELQVIVADAVLKSKVLTKFHVEGRLYGGGIHAQAEALRHGISRALVKYDLELRKRLKKLGFLKRDPRMKERRKFGLKKARKAPQWSKR